MSSGVVAIDIGGTKITGALVRTEPGLTPISSGVDQALGRIISNDDWTVPTPRTGGLDVAAAVTAIAVSVATYAKDNGYIVSGVGIGSAGVIDSQGRKIASATDAIPGWSGTDLADIVEEGTSLRVVIENDVHAHARGEVTAGAGAGYGSALMIAVGTGIGGAIALNGDILRGSHGLAGHLGHIVAPGGTGQLCSCGKDGHLEAIASGPGMTRWFVHRGGTAENAVDLERQAIAGDPLACQVLAEAAAATGAVIAGLVNSFDPDIAILGGGLARAGALYWEPLLASYQSQLMPALAATPLVPAALGTKAALLGAAALFENKFQS